MDPLHFLWMLTVFAFQLVSSTETEPPKASNTTATATTAPPPTEPPTTMATSVPKIAMRAFYVIIAISILVIIYFVARAICSRRRKAKTRRYGVLRENRNDNMELRPLSEADDDDDDDDDLTLFDLNKQKKRTKR